MPRIPARHRRGADGYTPVRKVRLADPEWEALSRVAEREGLLYGGVPSPAEAVRFLLKFYGEREARR